ncbi:MAG: phosphatase PAP2 family protein [Thermogemmatispora sp.]|uniref:phosphatase PAP2 family protein n=1 Tax=Thermogemmatispora sp. TaxID=1968838 RepID=UPI002614FDC2|nr:phosphatase PAP2 family protein [Thermogemmatispora sp.]MBX5456182.1 phosphatase PAP2 family protein [Thermogemmatispora sp.]
MAERPSQTRRQGEAPQAISGSEEETPLQEMQREIQRERLPWYRTLHRGQLLLALYTLLLGLFALLAWWVHAHPVLTIDVAITREFQEEQSPWLRTLMLAISFIGSVPLLAAGLVLVTAILLWLGRLRLEALILLGNCLSSELLNRTIKLLVARPRPSPTLVEVLQAASGASFPSGHVMAYVAYWGLLFSYGLILFQGRSWWRILLLLLSGFFIVMVGPSRIYLGDHWASDVLGGYLLGGVWLSLWLLLYLRLRERGLLTRVSAHEKPVLQEEVAESGSSAPWRSRDQS